jgi:outer membrane protein TolC
VRRFASLTEPQIDALATNLRGAAEKYSPTIVQASLASRQARSAVDLAKAGTLPSLNASWSSSVGLAGGNGTWSSALSLGLSLPLDVWTTQANVDSKMLAVRQADLDQEESKRTLELEIEASVFDIISAARAVLSSQKALDYAQSHSQSVQERYRLSSASLSDLSDAELLVSTNRTALITARSQFLTGISSLRTLAGLETDDLLIAIIP